MLASKDTKSRERSGPQSAGNMSSIPGTGTKILHAVRQLRLCATATEAHEPRAHASQQGKPLQWEGHTQQLGEQPLLPTTGGSLCSNEDQHDQKSTKYWKVSGFSVEGTFLMPYLECSLLIVNVMVKSARLPLIQYWDFTELRKSLFSW